MLQLSEVIPIIITVKGLVVFDFSCNKVYNGMLEIWVDTSFYIYRDRNI